MYCWNSGDVYSSSERVGGIVGYGNYQYVQYSFNTGSVRGSRYVGGITGYDYTNSSGGSSYAYRYCSNTGSITATSGYVAGIAGYTYSHCSTSSHKRYFYYCYNAGPISGSYKGSIVGYTNGYYYLSSCYYVSSYANANAYNGTNSGSTPTSMSKTTSISGFNTQSNNNLNSGYQLISNMNYLTFVSETNSGTSYDYQATSTGLTSQRLMPNAFTNTGYPFNGWNTARDGSGTHYNDCSTYTINSKTNVLYAEWLVNISVSTNDSSLGSAYVGKTSNSGTLTSLNTTRQSDAYVWGVTTSQGMLFSIEIGSETINFEPDKTGTIGTMNYSMSGTRYEPTLYLSNITTNVSIKFNFEFKAKPATVSSNNDSYGTSFVSNKSYDDGIAKTANIEYRTNAYFWGAAADGYTIAYIKLNNLTIYPSSTGELDGMTYSVDPSTSTPRLVVSNVITEITVQFVYEIISNEAKVSTNNNELGTAYVGTTPNSGTATSITITYGQSIYFWGQSVTGYHLDYVTINGSNVQPNSTGTISNMDYSLNDNIRRPQLTVQNVYRQLDVVFNWVVDTYTVTGSSDTKKWGNGYVGKVPNEGTSVRTTVEYGSEVYGFGVAEQYYIFDYVTVNNQRVLEENGSTGVVANINYQITADPENPVIKLWGYTSDVDIVFTFKYKPIVFSAQANDSDKGSYFVGLSVGSGFKTITLDNANENVYSWANAGENCLVSYITINDTPIVFGMTGIIGELNYECSLSVSSPVVRMWGYVADVVIIVNRAHLASIKQGLLDAGFDEGKIYEAIDMNATQETLKSILVEGDVVLWENDLPDNYI